MAKSNLGRNRTKTVVTVLSLSLAVVLLNLTVTFTNGFDMDKYLANFVTSDFDIFRPALSLAATPCCRSRSSTR